MVKAYEPPQKQCSRCQQWKSVDEFYNYRSSSDGKSAMCKDCQRPNRPAPWVPTPRNCLNCQSEYTPTQSNQVYCCPQCREEATHQVGRFVILERDEFRCIYCGLSSVENAARLHVDHIIPRAAGGEDVASNLATACIRCNLEKGPQLMSKSNTLRLLAEVKKRNYEQGIESRLTIKLVK